MTNCFITRTGSFLPGKPVDNEHVHRFMGRLFGESRVKKQVLAANGIKSRHYALDQAQNPTHDLYELAASAVEKCLHDYPLRSPITYLSAGSSNTPLIAPGLASILHSVLHERDVITNLLEICSNAGVCTSAAQSLTNAYRAVATGAHERAVCVGAEQASAILKSSAIRPVYDLPTMLTDIKRSKWFMSVFLRFMLSDGAGAFLLEKEPALEGCSFAIDWIFAQSFANQAPLCMKLEPNRLRLSQDLDVLSKYLAPCAKEFVANAMEKHGERLGEYRVVLPHLSSYFFKRRMERVLRDIAGKKHEPAYWTNLSTVGNTGAASIFIMLDEYQKTHSPETGERILLFIPESGQFNFVLVSLTVVRP